MNKVDENGVEIISDKTGRPIRDEQDYIDLAKINQQQIPDISKIRRAVLKFQKKNRFTTSGLRTHVRQTEQYFQHNLDRYEITREVAGQWYYNNGDYKVFQVPTYQLAHYLAKKYMNENNYKGYAADWCISADGYQGIRDFEIYTKKFGMLFIVFIKVRNFKFPECNYLYFLRKFCAGISYDFNENKFTSNIQFPKFQDSKNDFIYDCFKLKCKLPKQMLEYIKQMINQVSWLYGKCVDAINNQGIADVVFSETNLEEFKHMTKDAYQNLIDETLEKNSRHDYDKIISNFIGCSKKLRFDFAIKCLTKLLQIDDRFFRSIFQFFQDDEKMRFIQNPEVKQKIKKMSLSYFYDVLKEFSNEDLLEVSKMFKEKIELGMCSSAFRSFSQRLDQDCFKQFVDIFENHIKENCIDAIISGIENEDRRIMVIEKFKESIEDLEDQGKFQSIAQHCPQKFMKTFIFDLFKDKIMDIKDNQVFRDFFSLCPNEYRRQFKVDFIGRITRQ